MENESQKLLLTNALVVTLGEENRVFAGEVLLDGNKIAKLAPGELLSQANPQTPRINLKGMVLMPGFLNAHQHLYSTFARGMGLKDAPPANFVEILERLWWRLDKALSFEDIYYSALTPLLEGLKRGVTTIIDHHASQGAIAGSLETVSRACLEVGVRHALCFEVSDRFGAIAAREGIEENRRFLSACREVKNDMQKGAFGLHASFTLGPETLKRSLETAREFHSPLHCHVAEDFSDVKDCLDKYGLRVLERFRQAGALELPFIAAHCIHLDEREMEIALEHPVYPVHNPQSNMSNAVGTARIPEFLHRGLNVGLGTDGFTNDVFKELSVMPLPHRMLAGSPQVFPFEQIYRVAFLNNFKLARLFFESPLGVIKEGAYADLIALEYHPPTPISADNFMGHLLFGLGQSRVDTVLVDGRLRLQGGVALGVDEEKIAYQSRVLAGKLWERY